MAGPRIAGPVAGVEIHDLRQRLGRNDVLHGVGLSLGTGVFGLLGPNGAGKTTLLRVLATVLRPTDGEVRLLGRDPADGAALREIRRRLGYLPQQLGYYPNFTTFEFVEYFALLKEVPPREVRPAVARALARVGLEDKARAKLRTLSGGMLRRVGIAQAIVNEPSLLLLDEPTVGLDPEQRVSFRTLLREMGERSTVFVCTHLVEDVATACTEVGLMESGRIVFRGTPVDLAALGAEREGTGDSALERGYGAAIAGARAERSAANGSGATRLGWRR